MATPTLSTDGVNKTYVDTIFGYFKTIYCVIGSRPADTNAAAITSGGIPGSISGYATSAFK